jgi:retinol-binding protein 3
MSVNNMKKSQYFLILALAFLALITLDMPSVPAQGGPKQPDFPIDAEMRSKVIESAVKNLRENYVFPEMADKMEKAIRERLTRKEYDSITTGAKLAETLTAHFQEVSRDKHLRVRYSNSPIPSRERGAKPTAEELERFRSSLGRINFGFEKVERLPGNVGYLELRGFIGPEFAGETAAAAMNFLANTDSLIIDLRKNGGGSPAMVALLCSYLFGSEPVHLNDLYWRAGNRTEQWWTLPSVPGKRYTGKDVYVLTSNDTFSAAEEFTYNLKNLKRAVIIGETTGGGANPGGTFRINEHFDIFVPTGRAINPITGTNWEGTGVKPDLEMPADLALKTAHIEALKKSLQKASDTELADALKSHLENLQKELDELKAKKQ